MYVTGSAAGDYDLAPYDAMPVELTSLETVQSASTHWGLTGTISDVLDLGCGFGRQLAQVAPGVSGRLVGVDASGRACDGASANLEPWSGRTKVHQATFEEVNASDLGSFDLIYSIGTFYTVPRPTRDAALKIMGTCLRPGGRILLSYYAGTRGAIHAATSSYIRAMQPGGQSIPDAIALARQHLATALQFETPSPVDAVRFQIEGISGYDDTVMLHEMLGHGVHLQSTAEVASQLALYGIGFQGYLGYDPSAFDCDLSQKLYRAETFDLLEGGYRYAMFAKLT